MVVEILAIIVAALLAFLAFKFVTGMLKFVVIAAIVIAAILFATGGLAL